MAEFTDGQEIGVFPLQDHESGVPIGVRHQLLAGRIASIGEMGSGDGGIIQVATEHDKAAVGDVHPWFFWQTEDREERASGSFAQAFPGIVTKGAVAGASGHTQTPGQPAEIHPVQTGLYHSDVRYHRKVPGWPKCFPDRVGGQVHVVMPGMRESAQHDLMLHADPRLVCPQVKGPFTAGTVVVDLQEEGEMCMDNSATPGVGGRSARIQSFWRVIAMPKRGIPGIGGGAGNAIAWNHTESKDGLIGHGLIFAKMGSGGPTTGGKVPKQPGPTTGPGGVKGPPRRYDVGGVKGSGGTGGGGSLESATGGDSSNPGTPSEGTGFGDEPEGLERMTPCEFGEFSKAPRDGYGLALTAALPAFGPIHAGFKGDKHQLGTDEDGHPCNSAHLGVNSYFVRNADQDGPLKFDDKFPEDVRDFALNAHVYLGWDRTETHPWVGGDREGKWRWWTTVPYFAPPDEPSDPDKPTTGGPKPTGPTTPGPGGPGGPGGGQPGQPKTPTGGGGPGKPITPSGSRGGPPSSGTGSGKPPAPGGQSIGGGGPQEGRFMGGGHIMVRSFDRRQGTIFDGAELNTIGDRNFVVPATGEPALVKPRGAVTRVGDTDASDVGNYAIHFPVQTGFASVAFRPQLWVDGYPSFDHNPHAPSSLIASDEAVRPHVLTMHAWGAQGGDGEWDYTTKPEDSRARGGVAAGGVLFHPPHLTMEDYYGIGSTVDVAVAETAAHVTVAPGVGFALGTPTTVGGLNPKSIVVQQDPADTTNQRLLISQLNAAGAAIELVKSWVDQSSGEVLVDLGLGGTQAVRIPQGSSALRPVSLAPEGAIRINTDVALEGVPGGDRFEFYDGASSSWEQPITLTWAASNANGSGASLIGIEDALGLYTATDVEGALEELGQQNATIGPQAPTFTATGFYAFRHARGAYPIVQVLDSNGVQIEVCVTHPDVDTVVLTFDGTLTDAVLILN